MSRGSFNVELFQICKISFHLSKRSALLIPVLFLFLQANAYFSYLVVLLNAFSRAIFESLDHYLPIDPLILVASIMAPVFPLKSQETITC